MSRSKDIGTQTNSPPTGWEKLVFRQNAAWGELLAEPAQAALTGRVQFQFILNQTRRSTREELLAVNGHQIPLALIRNPRARRYVLRLRPDGSVRVTVPHGGSETEARRFAERQQEWLAQQLQRRDANPIRPKQWLVGTEILFRGEPVPITVGDPEDRHLIRFGDVAVKVPESAVDLRPIIEKHLWKLAAQELPPRVFAGAALHQVPVRRVTVRNQRSRWGSCSRRGTISLNWRLIQTPVFVQDYILIHELMHLRQMNHSARFWHEVERACPDYETAERWLKQHSALLK